MVEEKWVQILFVVFISLQVPLWCVVGEEEGTDKPTEKDGGKRSWSTSTGNNAWGGGFVGYGSNTGGAGGYVYENGGENGNDNDHTGGADRGYGVGIGVGGSGGGGEAGYGIGVGTGNAAGSIGGGGGGYGGGTGVGGGYGVGVGGGQVVGNVGGGGYGVGAGGGRAVGNNGGGGGGGAGVGVGIGIGIGGGGFVTPGVSGQPFFCTPLSCSNGQCNRLALDLGIQPLQENRIHPSSQESNGHDRSYQNVAPAPAGEVDGRSSTGQKGLNYEGAEHDALYHHQIPEALSPTSG